MWNYPKNPKHQAFIDRGHAEHQRELAKALREAKKQERVENARHALDEVKANQIATRAKTARLRAERLVRLGKQPLNATKSGNKPSR